MAKGRTNQPVVAVVENDWDTADWVRELREYGHTVLTLDQWVAKYAMTGSPVPHLYLLRAAHGWHEALSTQTTRKDGTPYRPFIDAAVKAARQRRRAQ